MIFLRFKITAWVPCPTEECADGLDPIKDGELQCFAATSEVLREFGDVDKICGFTDDYEGKGFSRFAWSIGPPETPGYHHLGASKYWFKRV